MRVKGVYEKCSLFILIDTGSTHNFMDAMVAEKLECEMKPAGITRVAVADGSKLEVSAKIDVFQWNFQSISFKADFMVIPLGGCDMVLGVQWLQQWGPITWDFQNLTMQFKMGKKSVLLHGIKDVSIRELKSAKLNKLREEDVQLAMISVNHMDDEEQAKAHWRFNQRKRKLCIQVTLKPCKSLKTSLRNRKLYHIQKGL